MDWALILSGVSAVGLLALGFDLVAPLGGALDTLCDLAGIGSAMLFVGLSDGA